MARGPPFVKCHCHDASTAVASDPPQTETTCHTVSSATGERQVNTVCLLSFGVARVCPHLPGTKQVSLLFFFFRLRLQASTWPPWEPQLHFAGNQTSSSFAFRNLWLVPSVPHLASESVEKLMTVHFLPPKMGLTGESAAILPRTKVCLSLESPLSVLNIIKQAFIIVVSDAFAGCEPNA